jgi:uncharacterized phage protein (TIGR02218 family)
MSIADGELTSLALCWRLERSDGAGIALTSHDQALTRDQIAYAPSPGMMPASIKRSLGLEPDSTEVAGALSSDALDEQDLALGRWDGATMQLTAMDWANAEADPIALLAGEIGTVTVDGEGFTADLQGAAAKLDNPVCPATSPECRAMFGDKRCRVDLAGRTITARVIEADGPTLTLDTSVDDRFVFGRLRYMSGANCGLSSVILSASGTAIQLRDWPRAAVESGCRVDIREGCDKRLETCVSRFDNAANFRGEPHLPGNDLLTRYPGA